MPNNKPRTNASLARRGVHRRSRGTARRSDAATEQRHNETQRHRETQRRSRGTASHRRTRESAREKTRAKKAGANESDRDRDEPTPKKSAHTLTPARSASCLDTRALPRSSRVVAIDRSLTAAVPSTLTQPRNEHRARLNDVLSLSLRERERERERLIELPGVCSQRVSVSESRVSS